MIDAAVGKVIEWVSLPVWLVVWLKRHRTVLYILIAVAVVVALIIQYAGLQGLLVALSFMARMSFAIMFILIQFIAMFWFLARGNENEVLPGDRGAVNFDDDYFGNFNEVELVREWTKLLTIGRKDLEAMGGKTLSGLLLSGPPGTGKTLMMQCLATDAHSAFFSLSATSLQAMFIGIGPLKVMRLFSKARKAAKRYGSSIIFIDEIDAIGGSRGMVEGDYAVEPTEKMVMGAGMGGGGLGVLSTLLVQMDGIKEIKLRDEIINTMRSWAGLEPVDPGVVLVTGATNRPDVLDTALTRPGRFDRQIKIGMPDASTRRALFNGYLRKVHHDPSIDVEVLTQITGGVSHAFIASSLQKDSVRLALFDQRDRISQTDIERSIEENVVGLPNPISDLDPEQKRQIAYHEAGHAVVAYLVRPHRRIANVSIIRRGSGILGYVRDVDLKEQYALPLRHIRSNVMVSVAGHIAVDIALEEPWTGASADFDHVRGYMRAMARMGEWGIPMDDYDPLANGEISEDATKWLQSAIKQTYSILEENRHLLDAVYEALLDHEELSSDMFYELMEKVQ